MIKTRLVGLLSHAKKYIVYTILWQWAALLSQVLAVFSIADLLEKVVYQNVTTTVVERTVIALILVVIIRFICERMGARSAFSCSTCRYDLQFCREEIFFFHIIFIFQDFQYILFYCFFFLIIRNVFQRSAADENVKILSFDDLCCFFLHL